MQSSFKAISVVFYLILSIVMARKRSLVISENEVFEKTYVITAKFPKIELPVEPQRKEPVITRRRININVDPVEENCSGKTFKNELNQLRQKIKCIPRDTVVNLIPPFGAMLTPNAVVVKRCGGMCYGLKRCISAEKRDVKFYVKTIKDNQIHCTSIMVSEDTKCKCDCLQKLKDCNSNQIYNKTKCACICKNENDYIECMENPNENFQWDESGCICVCQQNKSCTTGTYWNENLCRCVRGLT